MRKGASWAPDGCPQNGDSPNSPFAQLAASMPSVGTAEMASDLPARAAVESKLDIRSPYSGTDCLATVIAALGVAQSRGEHACNLYLHDHRPRNEHGRLRHQQPWSDHRLLYRSESSCIYL